MGMFDLLSPQKRFEKRLMKTNEGVLRSMLESHDKFKFNMGLLNSNALVNPEKAFTRTLAENSVWIGGVPEELEYFYKTTFPSLLGYSNMQISTSYFWHKVSSNTPRVHSGLPSLISRTMVNLIAGPGFDFEVVDIVEGEEVTEVRDDEATDRLLDILEDNCFEDVLLPNAILAESYGGYVGFKISQDDDITEHPILEVAIPEVVEVITRRGRQQAIIFKTTYEEDDKVLELHEIYTTDMEDNAVVTYELFENTGGKMRPIKFKADQAERFKEKVLVGFKGIAALVKNNTTANTQFKGSVYGLSDYNNSQSIFNALDENLSQELTTIRFNRPKRFFSKDLKKETRSGTKSGFDDFETDYEMIDGDADEDTNKYFAFDGKFDIENYTKADVQLMMKALNNAGLSPKTVGLLSVEAVNASDDSQRGKEAASLRTREMKLKLWRKTLETLFVKLLQFDDIVNKNVEAGEYNITINFNEFLVPTIEQRIKTAGEALNAGVADIKEAIDITYLDDKTDARKKELVTNIKIENGVPLVPTDEVIPQEPIVEVKPVEEPEAT